MIYFKTELHLDSNCCGSPYLSGDNFSTLYIQNGYFNGICSSCRNFTWFQIPEHLGINEPEAISEIKEAQQGEKL